MRFYEPHEYHFPTAPRDGQLRVGVELEVELGRDGAGRDTESVVSDMRTPPWCFVTYDGSLNNGLEVVSKPYTYDEWMSNWPLVRGFLKRLRDRGFRAYRYNNCGIHTHLSRSALPSEVLERIVQLMYEHPTWAQKLARRSTHWASFSSDVTPLVRKARDIGYQKYQAINTSGSRTVEIRIWRGTLDSRSLLGIVSTVSLLHRWAKKQVEDNVSDARPASFVTFAKELAAVEDAMARRALVYIRRSKAEVT